NAGNAIDHVEVGDDVTALIDHQARAHAVHAAGSFHTARSGFGRHGFVAVNVHHARTNAFDGSHFGGATQFRSHERLGGQHRDKTTAKRHSRDSRRAAESKVVSHRERAGLVRGRDAGRYVRDRVGFRSAGAAQSWRV